MLKIYTYTDPYHLDEENFWDEIKDLPHFCASQTLANGLTLTYKHFNDKNIISTIKKLINNLYNEWISDNTIVHQMLEVDTLINNVYVTQHIPENVKNSLLLNNKSIVNSIRILTELNIKERDFDLNILNVEQKILYKIYLEVLNNKNSKFNIQNNLITKEIIDSAIIKTFDLSDDFKVDDTIVIDGVHQFTPDILRTITEIGKYKNIILLFNYQKQYKNIYKTWTNIYSLFEEKIKFSKNDQFIPSNKYNNSFLSNQLADNIGQVYEGNNINKVNDIEVLEFENMTQFANYCGRVFEKSLNYVKEKKLDESPLKYMMEQFYSPCNEVNNILKSYFPEQFGDRHFLDYPIGHFFVSAMNMWDESLNKVVINDFDDIKECLQCGILEENKKGSLLNTFNLTLAFFENEKQLDQIIIKLQTLSKYVKSKNNNDNRIGYFIIEYSELKALIDALKDLNSIIISFFTDFNSMGYNFNSVYNKIKNLIKDKLENSTNLDDEMKDVINKLLSKLNGIKLTNRGSFVCLRQTMSYFLNQNDYINKGAKWIVKGFEQIDGDILRSATRNAINHTYHFCCLSDSFICNKSNQLPWPLDLNFFEKGIVNIDKHYQIYLKSLIEYKNFNRYALLYGLEFNRTKLKLSYVKSVNKNTEELYFVFKMLGINIKKYSSYENSNCSITLNIPENIGTYSFNKADKIKSMICPYKFVLESILQEKTIYRERFLIHHYMKVLISNNILLNNRQKYVYDDELKKLILDEYQIISDKFKLNNYLEKTKIIYSVYKFLKSKMYKNKFRNITPIEEEKMHSRKDFLYMHLDKYDVIDEDTFKKMIEDKNYETKHSGDCKYCASKDVCLFYEK